MKQQKLKTHKHLLMLLCLLGIFIFGSTISASATEEGVQTTEIPTPTEALELTEAPTPTGTLELTETPTPTGTSELTEIPTPTILEHGTPTPIPTPVIYTMSFYDEDGTTELYPAVSREKKDLWAITLPTPQKRGYTFSAWVSVKKPSTKLDNNHFYNQKATKDVTLQARWTINQYNITYNMKGGYFNEEEPADTYTVASNAITFPTPVRKKYVFDGWYTSSSYSGNKVTGIAAGSTGDVILYAKWKKVKPEAVTVKSLTNPSGKLKVTLKKVTGVKGYEIKIAIDKKFKKSVMTYDLAKKTSLTLSSVSKKTYYVKARAYAYDSLGNKVYGSYGKTVKKKVTKATKEYAATSTSAKINKAVVKDTENIQITATIKKRIKSSDDYYYLVKLNPSTNAVESVVKKVWKDKKLTIALPITGGNVGNLLTKYAIAIKQNGKYKLISKSSYITNPEKSASNTSKYVLPASKKGIQGATIHQGRGGIDIGTKHTLLNLDLKYLVGDSSKASGAAYYSDVVDGAALNYKAYEYNGKTYYFSDYQIGNVMAYNKDGISVTAVILLSWNDNLTYLIHPSARTAGKHYYTLNSEEKKARETLEALFCYLGETFGKTDCYVSNWVLGNEANAHRMWNYAGNLSLDAYTKSYAQVFKMMYYGVKHGYSNARCFICIDHEWNKASNGFSGKGFLTSFANAIKAENPKVTWNIAFHAYPAPLTAPDFWNNAGVTNDVNTTPYITPKNIEVLTSYVKKTYGKNTRIILSEQGFTSAKGESIQAAALAYAYYKCQFNSMIDAFIIRSEYDVQVEINQGLSMGLISQDGNRLKEAFYVYKYMDTKQAESVTNKYLSTIGASSWKSIVPGYSASELKKLSN